MLTKDVLHDYSTLKEDLDDRVKFKFEILLDGYRKMFDQSFSKSKDLGDMRHTECEFKLRLGV